MKTRFLISLLAGFIIVTVLNSSTGGYSSNHTGATGATGCSCHGSTSSLSPTVELDSAGIPVTSYVPQGSYTIVLKGTNGSSSNWPACGFELSAVKITGAGTSSASTAGTWGTLPSGVRTRTNGSVIMTEQSTQIAATSGTGGNGTKYQLTIPWTAPAAGTGSVKLYGILNAVNNNNSTSGDGAQLAPNVTITEQAAGAESVSVAITSGSSTICEGTSVTFTATPANAGSSPGYQWQVNGVTQAGNSGATYTTSSLPAGSVSVVCILTGAGGTVNSNTLNVTVNAAPVVSISASGNTLTAQASGVTSYQWYLDGTLINGATGSTCTATSNGNYTVTVTGSNGCTATSASYAYGTTGINSIPLSQMINIYPTITTGMLQISKSVTSEKLMYTIYGLNGSIYQTGALPAQEGQTEINIGNLAASVYIIKIHNSSSSTTYKIVKQ